MLLVMLLRHSDRAGKTDRFIRKIHRWLEERKAFLNPVKGSKFDYDRGDVPGRSRPIERKIYAR